MRVSCIVSNFLLLDDKQVVERLKKYLRVSDGELSIKIGAQYNVYGILFRENSPWYYICHSENDASPTPYPSELFEVIDEHLSEFWCLDARVVKEGVSSCLVFPEWAEDPSFFEDLIEGSPRSTSIFSGYRRMMDAEVEKRNRKNGTG
jgi:hypothetical protein